MLKSLEDLDYLKERIKIVFVEGYLDDGTYDVLADWMARMKGKYYDVVLVRAKSNIPQARNICIRNMEGDYILFWNADTLAPADSLKVMLEILGQSKALAAICTSYTLVDPRDMKAYGWMPRDDFVAFKREAFDLVGCFNELFYVGEYEILRRGEEKVKDDVIILPFTCIHLALKPSLKEKFEKYIRELKHYFLEYSKIYALGFYSLLP